MENISLIITGVVGVVLGVVIGRLLFANILKKVKMRAQMQAEQILDDAKHDGENLKKDKLLEAKEQFLVSKAEFDTKVEARKREILENENKIRNKQNDLNQKLEQVQRKEGEITSTKQTLNRQLDLVSVKRKELEQQHDEHIQKLEKVSNLSAVDAKAQLMEALKEEAKTDAMSYVKTIQDEAKQKASKEARKIIIQTIQRTAAEQAIENAISVFNLDSDDVKGQIIGREGRNIRALEAATGVEIIVDDTPEAVVISGFDPLRREIARISMQRLVSDGRIHPASI
ncbi:MAG: DUF3552 domain-containing protein, partial [Bacteroidetes bacterium]|nr:DUF3552 domain-containing protein [Bacteroidota bacterium]